MNIKINGENREIEKEITITELLVLEKVKMPETVSVQVNDEFIDQDSYENTKIKDGDDINFLYFMGGGA